MNFDDLIGLEESKVRKILLEAGYKNIETVINTKENDKCNKTLVCAVQQDQGRITLICGKFYIIGE